MREPSARPARRGLALLLFALFAVGFVARVAPLFERDGRLLQQYPTEDGYLMLTIARNIALGHGMSTAEGTIPTNGTQPLVNLLWALGFKLFGGDRTLGVLIKSLCTLINAIAQLLRNCCRSLCLVNDRLKIMCCALDRCINTLLDLPLEPLQSRLDRCCDPFLGRFEHHRLRLCALDHRIQPLHAAGEHFDQSICCGCLTMDLGTDLVECVRRTLANRELVCE